MSIWACSGIRQTEKMFLDLSESIPAQARTELNQKMFLDLNRAGGSFSQKSVLRAILRWREATRVS
jgi:hypothetical protein